MGGNEIARRLRIGHKAEQDLGGIFRYTIQNWGSHQARAYRDLLFRAINGLTKRPARGECVSESATLRSVKAGRHRVYYSYDDEEVRVVRVLHHAMDAPRHLS